MPAVKRRGKEYRQVKRLDQGNLGIAGPGTSRHKIFFDATRNGKVESLVRAWRGKNAEQAIKELRRYYGKNGYEVRVDAAEFIEGSIKD